MSGSILSLSEYERIKRSVLPPTHNDSRTRRRAELKQLSNDKQRNWPNTLDALRQKKIDFVKDKADAEEKARQEVDRIVSNSIVTTSNNFSV